MMKLYFHLTSAVSGDAGTTGTFVSLLLDWHVDFSICLHNIYALPSNRTSVV